MIKFDEQGFALESGEITVYQTDSQGVYLGKTTEFVSTGGGLAQGSYLEQPPKIKEGFAIVRVGNGWQYQPDHRGEKVYSTVDKTELAITELGEIPENYTALAPTCTHCEWSGSAWVLTAEKQAEIKAQQQEEMRTKINAKRDEVCFGGVFVASLNKWFDSDETSFVKMIGAKAVMDDDFSAEKEITPELWICADNSVTHLNRDDFALIIRTIKENVSAMHALAVQHKMQMETVENPLDYDYSQGWAKTYNDYVTEQEL
ncbi:hypothetical protein A4G18_07415 [Pasteurellaceae bacterium Pebbles2]|nr:hypothetical protein [Pasteurellaceae bacterium Pebbles2]